MNQLTELLPKIFCWEIPDDIYKPHIQDGKIGDAWADEEFMPYETLPPGTYSILFASKEAGEEDWKGVVERVSGWENIIYYNYTASGRDYRDTVESAFHRATESGLSLLTSKGLDTNKNYLVIKQID